MDESKSYKRLKIIFNIIILIVAIGIIISYLLNVNGLGYAIIGGIIALSSILSIYKELRES